MKRVFDHLQTSHDCRRGRVKILMAEKIGLLDIINDEKKESKSHTNSIQIDAKKVYSYSFLLM